MTTQSPAQVLQWLERLGDKFLGDGVCEPMRASDILAALQATTAEPPVAAQPIARLTIFMDRHDMGQSLAPNPPFKSHRIMLTDWTRAEALPLGRYPLYLAQADAEPAAPQAQGDARPTEPGLYAWVPEHGAPAIVQVHKRPTDQSPGLVLNGSVVPSSAFYDGCAISKWPATGWVNLRAARASKE